LDSFLKKGFISLKKNILTPNNLNKIISIYKKNYNVNVKKKITELIIENSVDSLLKIAV